jgi:CubicO group peptidase (beta-lactamase class C family)
VVDHPATSRWRDTASFPSGGAGLVSTVDDYLKFARLMQRHGEVDGVRLLSRKTVELMATNHLSAEERRTPFLGQDFWSGQGFGLGLSMVDDVARYEAYASAGRFGWPGAYGTFWCADPREDMVLLMMIQLYFGKECKIGLDFQTLAYQAIAD